MSNFVSDRRLITERVLALLEPDYTTEQLDQCMIRWWKNIRSSGGFGLTVEGDTKFTAAGLESWNFSDGIVQNSFNAMIFGLSLDKKMVVPYYAYFSNKTKYVRVYDSRVAMIMELYGNVGEYLNTLEARK